MDIAALSISMSQASLSQAVGLRVMSMAKNQADIQSQGLVQMMAKSVDPNLGNELDVSV